MQKITFLSQKNCQMAKKYLDASYENLKIIMLNNEISEKLFSSLLTYS